MSNRIQLYMTFVFFIFILIFVLQLNRLPPNTGNKRLHRSTSSRSEIYFRKTGPGEGSSQRPINNEQTPISITDKILLFKLWRRHRIEFCGGNLTEYGSKFARLCDVIIDKQFFKKSIGGNEYYRLEIGAFQMICNESSLNLKRRTYSFHTRKYNHLNDWMANTRLIADDSKWCREESNLCSYVTWNRTLSFTDLYNDHQMNTDDILIKVPQSFKVLNNYSDAQLKKLTTIAIIRYEYVNFYHSMCDWYNAFIVVSFFEKNHDETRILFLDDHPAGLLDPVWQSLFNKPIRIGKFSPRRAVMFSDLVWGIPGYYSQMEEHLSPELPLVEEFRNFFLRRFQIRMDHRIRCDSLSILVIWRRDFVSHRNNPTGFVSRKIQNEQELLTTLQSLNPRFLIRGIQLDQLSMVDQLKSVVKTDLLIGMHGAGLTHALFLPPTSGLLELFALPRHRRLQGQPHFRSIARWRRLVYVKWTNEDPLNEFGEKGTKIPPTTLDSILKEMAKRLCGQNNKTKKH